MIARGGDVGGGGEMDVVKQTLSVTNEQVLVNSCMMIKINNIVLHT